MDAYPNKGKHKIIQSEIIEYAVKKSGVLLVNGFKDIAELKGVKTCGERIAGFMETSVCRDWYLPVFGQASMSWKTSIIPGTNQGSIGFVLSAGFGNGSPLPQPSGKWDVYVNDNYALSIRVVKNSQLWRNKDCKFAFTANRIEAARPYGSICLSSIITNESFASFGPAILVVPTSWLETGKPALIRIDASSNVKSSRWFSLTEITPDMIMRADIYQAIDLLKSARGHILDSNNIYFGDIHTHSGEVDGSRDYSLGCGMDSRKTNYEYARGPGGMDFYALTDHEHQIHPNKIENYMGLADEYNVPGKFVCLPAFEFTSLLYGHRNIYFKDTGGTVISSTHNWSGIDNASKWSETILKVHNNPELAVTPNELWAALKKIGISAITIPHHPSSASHPCSWDFYNPKYDRLVEIYSCWGSSEYYGDIPRGVSDRYRSLSVRDALKKGLRMGFAAASDGHDGHPGNAQSPMIKHHHLFHNLGSGLTAVICDNLTRESIFNALYNRRCYATTGVPILMSFDINNAVMGSEIQAIKDGKPVLRIKCIGTNGINHIRIMKNADIAATIFCHGEREKEIEWVDDKYSNKEITFYYIRIVQDDYESAWSSPIWIL